MTQTFRLGFSQIAISLSVACLATVFLVSQSGCHRSFYRREADADAKRLIREKQNDPRWSSTSDGSIAALTASNCGLLLVIPLIKTRMSLADSPQ